MPEIKSLLKFLLIIFLLFGSQLNAGWIKDAAKVGVAVGAVKATKKAVDVVKKSDGRSGKQKRLRDIAKDSKVASHIRGWIEQEQNAIKAGKRTNIRNPKGKDLAHKRGKEASKGYDYEHAIIQDKDLHKLQHKYDNFGKKNKENIVKDVE